MTNGIERLGRLAGVVATSGIGRSEIDFRDLLRRVRSCTEPHPKNFGIGCDISESTERVRQFLTTIQSNEDVATALFSIFNSDALTLLEEATPQQLRRILAVDVSCGCSRVVHPVIIKLTDQSLSFDRAVKIVGEIRMASEAAYEEIVNTLGYYLPEGISELLSRFNDLYANPEHWNRAQNLIRTLSLEKQAELLRLVPAQEQLMILLCDDRNSGQLLKRANLSIAELGVLFATSGHSAATEIVFGYVFSLGDQEIGEFIRVLDDRNRSWLFAYMAKERDWKEESGYNPEIAGRVVAFCAALTPQGMLALMEGYEDCSPERRTDFLYTLFNSFLACYFYKNVEPTFRRIDTTELAVTTDEEKTVRTKLVREALFGKIPFSLLPGTIRNQIVCVADCAGLSEMPKRTNLLPLLLEEHWKVSEVIENAAQTEAAQVIAAIPGKIETAENMSEDKILLMIASNLRWETLNGRINARAEEIVRAYCKEQGLLVSVERLSYGIYAHVNKGNTINAATKVEACRTELLAYSRVILNYLKGKKEPPERSDAIFVFGSDRVCSGDKAIELYLAGLAPYLVFTGGIGGRMGMSSTTPESEYARIRAQLAGVPSWSILTEWQSTNTEENIVLGMRTLTRKIAAPTQLLLVGLPYQQLRQWATFMRLMEDSSSGIKQLKLINSPASFPFYKISDPRKLLVEIRRMLGEVERIRSYSGNYIIPLAIPERVTAACREIKRIIGEEE